MENRRVMPGLFKGYPESLKKKDKEERDHTDPMYKPKKAEGARMKAEDRADAAKEPKLERSYTIDEMTVATLLKGHPQAQEILDELLKGKKKNESGEEFQDGSEDTIGGEGHAAVAHQETVHDGKKGGDHPGVATKNASMEDGDLEKSEDDEDEVEKSDNFTDNEPEEFEDGLVDGDGDDEVIVGKSLTVDEETLSHLFKTMGAERMEEILKAIGGPSVDPSKRVMLAQMPGGYKATPADKEDNPLTNRKVNPTALAALKNKLGTGGAEKSEGEDNDLEKSENNEEEGTDMSQDWSLDFSKSVLANMGLEKGSPSVSKKVSGGKATQISYSSKPETRFKHPKSKDGGETRYEHNVKEGTVTKKTGKKGDFKEGKPIDVSDEKKLKNASQEGFDLHKALDEILEKKTR